jgi:flagellar motility protein MotE (MotC chaperone)
LDGLEQKQVVTIEGHLTQVYLNNQFLFCVELENIHIHKPYREGKAITEKFQQHKRSRDYAARNASALQREAQEAKQEKAQLGYRVAQLEQELSTKDERLRKEILRVTTGLTD